MVKQEAYEAAEVALAEAIGRLDRVVEYADSADADVFAEYPRSLPSLDELVWSLRGIKLAETEDADSEDATYRAKYGPEPIEREIEAEKVHAWEIDAGPGGIYWEVGTMNDEGTVIPRHGNVATRAEAEAAGATEFHTVAEWEAEIEAENSELEAGRERVPGGLWTCAECGAKLSLRKGLRPSMWYRAIDLDGHLRDLCYRAEDNTWVGHKPASDRDVDAMVDDLDARKDGE